MRSVQMTTDVLTALTKVVRGVAFNPEHTRAACTPELLATQQALEQVAEGVPFRSAYRAVEQSSAPAGPVAPDAVLDAYKTSGAPGQECPDLVREQLTPHRDWIDEA